MISVFLIHDFSGKMCFFLHCKSCEAPLGVCVNYPFLPSTSCGGVAMRMSKCVNECGDDTYKSHFLSSEKLKSAGICSFNYIYPDKPCSHA